MLVSPDAPNMIALRVLERLRKHYEDDAIEEVVVNQPGEIWLKPRREDWRALEDADLTYEYFAQFLCPVLANINSAPFSENSTPIVACELPGQPYRFQCVVGNNVRYSHGDRVGVALAIRSLVKGSDITFANYGLESGIRVRGQNSVFENFEFENRDDIELIVAAVQAGMSVLVSGPTSSGKTTFLNQVIKLIDPSHRIISVEDARELNIEQPNRVHFVVPRHSKANDVGYNEIIDCLMRLTPDYVICGEVSVSNAGALFNLMGKGHPIMSTVHAGSPREALEAFANNMMSHGGMNADAGNIVKNLEKEVGCIVQLTKQRRISDITFPAIENHQRALDAANLRSTS